MKDTHQFPKTQPYIETEQYLDQLIASATERAIHQPQTAQHTAHRRLHRIAWAAAAAIILLIAGWGWHRLGSPSDPPAEQIVQSVSTQQGPLDTFLDGIADEEAAHIDCYKVDNIPQY